MKRFFVFLVLIFSSFFCFSQTKVALLKGISSFPFAYIYDKTQKGSETEISFVFFENIEDASLALYSNEIQACIFPILPALKLYEKNGGQFKALSVVQKTDYYLVSPESSFRTLSDFLGKKVILSENGFIKPLFLHILKENQIPVSRTNGGLNIQYDDDEAHSIYQMIFYKSRSGVYSEPAYSSCLKFSGKLYTAVNLQDEIEALYGKGFYLPSNLLLVNRTFAENYSDLAELLLEKTKESIDYLNNNVLEICSISRKYDLGNNSLNNASVIKNANFYFQNVKEAKQNICKAGEILKITAGDDFFYN